MPWRVLAPLIACAFTMGALLGGAEVATVAFSDEMGAKPLSGLMLAIWAIGSLVSGAVTGAVHLKASNATRFRWGMLALGLLMLPLPLVDGFVSLAVFLFLSGFAISPVLIASFAWIEETVPSGRITEGITLFTTGLGAGLAPGAALVGRVADGSGASSSYWVPAVAGLLGAAIAFLAALVTTKPQSGDSNDHVSRIATLTCRRWVERIPGRWRGTVTSCPSFRQSDNEPTRLR